MSPRRLRAYTYLLIVALIWGAAGPVIKFTLGGIDPFPFLTYRFGLSALVSVIYILFKGEKIPSDRKTFWELILFAFLSSTVALGLLFVGLQKTTVLDVTLITAVGPLLIALAGVALLKEHITKVEKTGMTIAFIGSLITLIEPVLMNNFEPSKLSGNFLVLLYLLIYTITAILAKKLVRKGLSPITLTNYTFIVGFITIIPFTLYTHGMGYLVQQIIGLQVPFHLGVIYMALLSGNLAYMLWVRGQKTIEVSEAALFAYLGPVFATPLAVFWLKEELTFAFLMGAILISIGVVIAEYKKKR